MIIANAVRKPLRMIKKEKGWADNHEGPTKTATHHNPTSQLGMNVSP